VLSCFAEGFVFPFQLIRGFLATGALADINVFRAVYWLGPGISFLSGHFFSLHCLFIYAFLKIFWVSLNELKMFSGLIHVFLHFFL